MLRDAGAFVAGMVVGMMANGGLIEVSMLLHPPPPGYDPSDQAQVTAFIESLPATGYAMAMLAHLAQAFFGALVGASISRERPMHVALAIGGFTMLGGIVMMMMVRHPVWMYAELPLYWVCAWGAAKLVLARRAVP